MGLLELSNKLTLLLRLIFGSINRGCVRLFLIFFPRKKNKNKALKNVRKLQMDRLFSNLFSLKMSKFY